MGTVTNKGGFKMVGKSQMDGGPVSPRKAEAGANMKAPQAKIPKYADGGCVTAVRGSSRVVGGGMKNGGKVKK